MLGRVGFFQLVRTGLGPPRIDAVFEAAHDRCVPRLVKIFGTNSRIDWNAVAAAVRIAGGVQRLMDVADEVDHEGQISERPPAVVVPVFQTLRVLVDFGGDAVAARASRGDVGTIVDDSGTGNYLTEFSDRFGQTYALPALRSEQFLVLHHIDHEKMEA